MTGGLIVAGMHRSGTSLTARLIASGGWDPGRELLADGRDSYWEDADFVAIHKHWLASGAGHRDSADPPDTHRDWGVVGGRVTTPRQYSWPARRARRDTVRRFAETRSAQHSRWMAKDPRATLFLEDWATAPGLRFVLIYRNPWDAADSAVRTGAELFRRSPSLAASAWLGYNRRLVRFVRRHRDRCLVIASQVLVDHPDLIWDELDHFAGMNGELTPDLVDASRYVRRDCDSTVGRRFLDRHPAHHAVLRALDAIADVPRETVP